MAGHNILIVDDEPRVAFFFQKNLEMINDTYTVDAVNSGIEAVRKLQSHHYDLMITDLRMPEMDGLELMARMRQISPQTQAILITAYGTQDVWEKANKLQIFRSFAKPLKIADLAACVQEALTQTHSTQSGILAFTAQHFDLLTEKLEGLRQDLSARTIVLADCSGSILAYAGSIEALDVDATVALLGGSMAASIELAQRLKYPKPIHLSYFEGPPYDLYTTNIDSNFFLMSLQDKKTHTTRMGLVWHYTQRTARDLRQMLTQKSEQSLAGTNLNQDFAESLQGALDHLFAPATTPPLPRPAPQKYTKIQPVFSSKLRQVLNQFSQQTNIKVEMHLEPLDIPLATPIHTLILKTVSAILKNTYAYGQATIIGISFSRNGRILYGRIVDNGIDFGARRTDNFDIETLKNEFKRKRGNLIIADKRDQGIQINFELPIIE